MCFHLSLLHFTQTFVESICNTVSHLLTFQSLLNLFYEAFFPTTPPNWSHPCFLWPTLCRYRLYLSLIWRILNFQSTGCGIIFVVPHTLLLGSFTLFITYLTTSDWHSRFGFCDAGILNFWSFSNFHTSQQFPCCLLFHSLISTCAECSRLK